MANTPGTPGVSSPTPPGSSPTSSPTATSSPAGSLSNRAHLVIGYLVAGAALVALADIAPEAAIGLTAVIGLGVVVTHANELQALSNAFIAATGH